MRLGSGLLQILGGGALEELALVGEAGAAVELSARLEEQGLLVPAIRPPSVPEGTARLRISLTAGHSQEDVMRLIQILKEQRQPH